jgi:hypothetical protein
MNMANKHLFPNAKALPPKAPKIKTGRWSKGTAAPSPSETPPEEATTATAEPAVVSMPAAEAKKLQPKAKKADKPKGAKAKKEGMSMTAAALKVLSEKGESMSCRDMIDAMATKGYWKSPGGLTPHNTLYSAFLRLIQKNGKSATIKKTEHGMFTLNPSAKA